MSIKAKQNCVTPIPDLFYVYAHVRETGEIFYIGKGIFDRAWRASVRRPADWKQIAENENWSVVILHSNLSESEALEKEKIEIQKHSESGSLINRVYNWRRRTELQLEKYNRG